jgi:hypothetical protein
MAVAAIDAESGNVMFVAEGNRLRFRLADIGEVTGPIDDRSGKAYTGNHEDDNKNTQFRECIAPRVE